MMPLFLATRFLGRKGDRRSLIRGVLFVFRPAARTRTEMVLEREDLVIEAGEYGTPLRGAPRSSPY